MAQHRPRCTALVRMRTGNLRTALHPKPPSAQELPWGAQGHPADSISDSQACCWVNHAAMKAIPCFQRSTGWPLNFSKVTEQHRHPPAD